MQLGGVSHHAAGGSKSPCSWGSKSPWSLYTHHRLLDSVLLSRIALNAEICPLPHLNANPEHKLGIPIRVA